MERLSGDSVWEWNVYEQCLVYKFSMEGRK